MALGIIPVALIGGLLGGIAMQVVMWAMSRTEWAHYNMLVAVGSMVTKRREGAFKTGLAMHAVSAVIFAGIYDFAMIHLSLALFPRAFYAGIGFGIIHGILVSLILVWIVAEQHPLPEFREAGLAVGLSHIVGHVAYGAVVGLVIGLASL